MDYYNLIFKRKSFHLFRNRETMSKEDRSVLKAFAENVVPLDQEIRFKIKIVVKEYRSELDALAEDKDIIACVITIGLTGMIVKPIRVTNGVLNQIADFHYQIDENYVGYAKKKDETGKMIRSMDILKNEIQSFLCEMEKSVAAVEQINKNIEDSVEKMHGMAKENESVGEQIQETYCMIQENSAHAKKLKTIVKKYIL